MLFEDTNFIPFMLTFLPALIYALVIFVSFPKKTICLKTAFLYFMLGSISVHAVSAVQWVLPNWRFQLEDFVTGMAVVAFVQVALLEESAKFLFYRFTNMYRGRLPKPLAIMFYRMCISAGFGVVENMMYAWRYGPDVLIVRAFSSIILHMLAGLMMGYFISLSVYIKRRKYTFRTIGLLAAVFIHGLYDFNLMVSFREYAMQTGVYVMETGMGVSSWYILGPGIVVVLLMFRHLKKLAKGKKRVSPPCVKALDQ